MSISKATRLLRLKQAEWRYQDRVRGHNYTTWRNGRPDKAKQRRDHEQLGETLILIAVLALGWLWFVVMG